MAEGKSKRLIVLSLVVAGSCLCGATPVRADVPVPLSETRPLTPLASSADYWSAVSLSFPQFEEWPPHPQPTTLAFQALSTTKPLGTTDPSSNTTEDRGDVVRSLVFPSMLPNAFRSPIQQSLIQFAPASRDFDFSFDPRDFNPSDVAHLPARSSSRDFRVADDRSPVADCTLIGPSSIQRFPAVNRFDFSYISTAQYVPVPLPPKAAPEGRALRNDEVNERFLPGPPGMVSEDVLRDIDRRILRRIAAGIPASQAASFDLFNDAAPALGTTQWLAQYLGILPAIQPSERAPEDADSKVPAPPNSDETQAATLLDLSGASSGGGAGGSSAMSTTASFYTLPAPVSRSSAFAASLSLAGPAIPAAASAVARASSSTASSTTSFSLAAPSITAIPAAVTAPTPAIFPASVYGYTLADLQPIPSNWTSSRAVRISFGKMGGYVSDASGNSHAAVWNISMTGFVDMQPSTGIVATTFPLNTRINDLKGQQAVGVGSNSHTVHALLWLNANPASVIDLNPSAYGSTYAQATTGSQQIGYGYLTTNADEPHALLWNGSATSFFDLNPSNYIFSYAYAGDSVHQVGYGQDTSFNLNALLWSGSAASAVSIHPTVGTFVDSRAVALSGNRAAGFGTDLSGYNHAILWTALNGASAIDINPAAFLDSQVTAMSAVGEVGYGRVRGDPNGTSHALLWNADGTGYVDLNSLLPARYTFAEADGIDSSGNVVGFAFDTVTGNTHAVEWLAAAPEPASLIFVTGLIAISFLRPRRRT